MRDKTAEIGLPSAIGAVLLLGLLFALGGNDDDLDTASGFVFFFGYLVGATVGWGMCKVHYKVKELQEEVVRLQAEVDDLQAEVDDLEAAP